MPAQKIKLTWDPKTNDVSSTPKTIDLIAGDTLVFMSDQGAVNLKFDPPENFGLDQAVNGALHVGVRKGAPARITSGVAAQAGAHGFPAKKVKTGVNSTPADA